MKLTPFQWSSFNFFGFFCAYGVILPFLPVWLKHYGYETEMIGLLVSFGYLFRFLGGMLSSQRVKQVSQFLPTARWLTWLNLAVVVGLILTVENIWLFFPMLMLFHIFNAGAMPIADSIASVWQQQVGLDYGKARLFGSLAFVVGSISTGYLVGWLGTESIVLICGAFLLLLGLGQLFTPTIGLQQPQQQEASISFSYWQILKEPTTFRMLMAVSLILASHAAYYTYSTIYWSSLGISTQAISLLWGLAVIAEIGLFFIAKRFFTRIRLAYLILISTLGTALRWTLLATTTDINLLAFSQLFHSLSFALAHFAMIRYISSQKTNKIAKLQGLYFGLGSCAMMAIFTFLSGIIYQSSPTWMFLAMTLFALPAIFIVPKRFSTNF